MMWYQQKIVFAWNGQDEPYQIDIWSSQVTGTIVSRDPLKNVLQFKHLNDVYYTETQMRLDRLLG